MTVECERWWAARFLRKHGHAYDRRPCRHPLCPELPAPKESPK